MRYLDSLSENSLIMFSLLFLFYVVIYDCDYKKYRPRYHQNHQTLNLITFISLYAYLQSNELRDAFSSLLSYITYSTSWQRKEVGKFIALEK